MAQSCIWIPTERLKIVIHVEEGGDCLRPENMMVPKYHERNIENPINVERRENPERPARVEFSERHSSEFLVLFEEQPSDKKPAQNKKYQDPQSAWNVCEAKVVENNQKGGHGPHAIESGKLRKSQTTLQVQWKFVRFRQPIRKFGPDSANLNFEISFSQVIAPKRVKRGANCKPLIATFSLAR